VRTGDQDVPRERTAAAALKHDRHARRERINVHILLFVLFNIIAVRAHPIFIRLIRVRSTGPADADADASRALRPPTNGTRRGSTRRKSQYCPTLCSIFSEALLAILSSETRCAMRRSALHARTTPKRQQSQTHTKREGKLACGAP
jgi:hypothetical protein